MLNMFNRIAVIFLLATIILCAAVSAVGVWSLSLVPALPGMLTAQTTQLIEATAALTPELQAVISIVAVLILFAGALLLIVELRPSPTEEVIPVHGANGGATTMVSTAVTQRLRHAVDRLDDVIEVTPLVKRRRDGIEVWLDVRTTPEIDVPMKDNEIKQVTRTVVEEQMGLKLKKLTIKLDHAPFEYDVA